LPDSVTSIGDYAFYDCTGLTSVTIPDSVTAIGKSAFNGCSGLTSVTIPNSVKTIGERAFYYCTGLTSVTIPNSVTSIGENAFNSCSALTRAEFASIESLCGIKFYNAYSNPLKNAHNLYIAGVEVKDLVIPNSVTSIGEYALDGCSSLTSVTIPNSVDTIGGSAFSACSHLRSVVLLHGDEIKFGSDVFSNTNIRTAYVDRIIANGVIPVNNLETLTIGNTVTEISDSAWSNARYLKTLKLGSSLASIGNGAFSGCTTLTEVVVPPSVEAIGASAFAGNTSLSEITMGYAVKTIGEKAFDGCPASIVRITAQTPPTAPNSTFSNYTGKLWLQDPGDNSVIDAYYDAYTCWDRFDSYAMIVATDIKYEGDQTLVGNPGDTFSLRATLEPADVTLSQIFWYSTNPAVATVDANGLVTLQKSSDEVAALAEGGDYADCKIIGESLYANGPKVEITVNNQETGVEDIISDGDFSGDNGAIDYDSPVEVFTINGMRVASSMENLAPGIYVIRQGSKVEKRMIK
ncbi:MAG: leucine-rich repeat protein, partial [Muribaculaceae bacterium]|nr:leucine-rich repeat protein [Muribaculaceae bacterium]